MSYRLLVTKRAKKDIDRLDQVVKKKIKKRLEIFSQAPAKHSKKLISSKLGTYRYRIGNYRIIFDLEGKNIIILRVGHRREIYR